MFWFRSLTGVIALFAMLPGRPMTAADAVSKDSVVDYKVRQLSTPDGTRYFVLDNRPSKPAPTLIILAWDANATLSHPDFVQCGRILAREGYLCVSIDLPGHGAEQRQGETEGLAGWRARMDAGEDPIADMAVRAKKVLNYLVADGQADQKNIAVCGTSRGGYAALRFVAVEPRAKCVAVFAPVTDLGVLEEFRGADKKILDAQSLDQHVPQLATRPVWMIVGDHDARIDSDKTIDLARKLSASAISQGAEPRIELHVCPAPGHVTPAGAAEESAKWIAKVFAAAK